jgi:hypothetical protein
MAILAQEFYEGWYIVIRIKGKIVPALN